MSIDIGDKKEARLREAAEWLQRLLDAAQDERVLAEWREWCQSDPDNLDAFDKLQETWSAFDLPEVRAAAHRLREPAVAASGRSPRNKLRQKAPIAALAAGLTLVVAVGLLTHSFRTGSFAGGQGTSPDILTTESAERGSQLLADGSRVVLGAKTRISTRYTEQQRAVVVEYGEAFFTVVKDPQRPFVVRTGNVRVTAVGTTFSVRRTLDRTVVAVGEGIVRVAPRPALGGPGASPTHRTAHQVQLGAGEQVSFSPEAHRLSIVRVNPQSLSERLEGRLSFVEEPLGSVIADVNRYASRRIFIADPALRERLFTGTVYPDRIDDWLRALQSVFPLTVDSDGTSVSLLARAPAREIE